MRLDFKRQPLVIGGLIAVIVTAIIFLTDTYQSGRISDQNLAKFRELTLRDPLIVSYPIDADRLQEAATLLAAVEKSNVGRVIANDRIIREAAVLSGREKPIHFLPLRFLETLPDMARAYKNFTASPTRRNALRLISVQAKSARLYRDDALMLRKNLQKLIDIYQIPLDNRYFTLTQATMTTPGMILGDLELIAENGESLIQEAKARQRCLLDGLCPEPKKFVWETPAVEEKFTLLPENILFPYRDNILETSGPYVVPTVCFGFGPKGLPLEQPFYLVRERWSNLPDFIEAKLATDVYYTKLDPELGKNPLFKDLVDAGIKWSSHGEAPYRCNDLSFLPRLATLHWFTEELIQNGGVIANQNLDKESDKIEEAKKLEISLREAKYPNYRDARKLGKLYEEILAENRQLPNNLRERLTNLVVGLRNEWADLDRFLLMLANYQIELDEEMRISASLDAHYLFFTRMYPSLMFLVHSPSVWRLDKKPVLAYRTPLDFVPSPRIKTFTELRRLMTEEEIIAQTIQKKRLNAEFVSRAAERFRNILSR